MEARETAGTARNSAAAATNVVTPEVYASGFLWMAPHVFLRSSTRRLSANVVYFIMKFMK